MSRITVVSLDVPNVILNLGARLLCDSHKIAVPVIARKRVWIVE